MPRYEYECENGHKTVITRKFSEEIPRLLGPSGHGTYAEVFSSRACDKPLKRIYSTFSFTMS